jgi:hypothetical protein
MRSWKAILLSLILGAAIGCGGRGGVEGTVTINGKPVDGGMILFVPMEGNLKQAPTHADIKDGKYELPEGEGPEPGLYRVQVIWSVREANPKDPDIVRRTQLMPPKFSGLKSPLRAKVDSGLNTLNFELVGRMDDPVEETGDRRRRRR